MVDEMFDRNYQSGRAELNSGIDKGIAGFVAAMRSGFETLHRIQWDAPWAAKAAARRQKRRAGLA